MFSQTETCPKNKLFLYFVRKRQNEEEGEERREGGILAALKAFQIIGEGRQA